ncbi:cupin domain-containing protein [Candidatus Leptofilum sp.]|uniref:cupin domain-containing protein n=1 Tax=Candidatus Leptofilum sp. TaxID=3241576 RepID=UPI003B5C5B0A
MGRIELDETAWVNGRNYRKNRLADETTLSCSGALVQMVKMAPGSTIPNHVHQTSIEFYYVVSGECRLVINEENHRLQQGDMFLTRPGDIHRLYNESNEPFTLLVFKTNAAPDDTFWTNE